MKLKNSVFLCIIICLCLCSCSKEDSVINGAFGVGDPSKTELESNNQGVEITVEANEDDKFKIQDDIFSESTLSQSEPSTSTKTEEELEQESQQTEDESYLFYSVTKHKEVDSRDVFGYQGALEYISAVGLENVKQVSKSDLKKYLKSNYKYLNKSNLDYILNCVYSDDETVTSNFQLEIKHIVEPGWFQDENGDWVNVYEINQWE